MPHGITTKIKRKSKELLKQWYKYAHIQSYRLKARVHVSTQSSTASRKCALCNFCCNTNK